MTYSKVRQIFVKSAPSKADIETARSIQSRVDAIAHSKHVASKEDAEQEYFRRKIYERNKRVQEEASKNAPAPKKEKQLELPKEMKDKTMQQLGAENPREFFRLDPDPTVGVSTPEVEGFTVETEKKINVRNGQWYRVLGRGPDYYLQYCRSPIDGKQKCLLIDTTSVKPCYLVVSANMSYNGGYDIVHLSPSLFQDLIESRPPLAEILRVYRKTECSDVDADVGAFDLTQAVPLWSTME